MKSFVRRRYERRRRRQKNNKFKLVNKYGQVCLNNLHTHTYNIYGLGSNEMQIILFLIYKLEYICTHNTFAKCFTFICVIKIRIWIFSVVFTINQIWFWMWFCMHFKWITSTMCVRVCACAWSFLLLLA